MLKFISRRSFSNKIFPNAFEVYSYIVYKLPYRLLKTLKMDRLCVWVALDYVVFQRI